LEWKDLFKEHHYIRRVGEGVEWLVHGFFRKINYQNFEFFLLLMIERRVLWSSSYSPWRVQKMKETKFVEL
jgi:hypothetical protein